MTNLIPLLLTALFVTLKLSVVIFWPWVWVLSPLWIWCGSLCVYIFAEYLDLTD